MCVVPASIVGMRMDSMDPQYNEEGDSSAGSGSASPDGTMSPRSPRSSHRSHKPSNNELARAVRFKGPGGGDPPGSRAGTQAGTDSPTAGGYFPGITERGGENVDTQAAPPFPPFPCADCASALQLGGSGNSARLPQARRGRNRTGKSNSECPLDGGPLPPVPATQLLHTWPPIQLPPPKSHGQPSPQATGAHTFNRALPL